jgi:hypothetical protein
MTDEDSELGIVAGYKESVRLAKLRGKKRS